ncbi:unannotated protein [freshwater metagenome]|uniref:Unannotated protein n=1 Tax=freshwater metagenome TaxID=449393 RepID=A0A6J7ITD8_9ZZZZ|nr:oxidoreductase [Actinomycetota bacterium]
MDLLILGGTAWLGRELSAIALDRGHAVTCIARGTSGGVAEGARFIAADRDSYDFADIAADSFDAIIELTWQPGQCGDALRALAGRAKHWTFVSSCSVYASHRDVDGDESAELLAATSALRAEMSEYGEAKVACEVATRGFVGDRLLLVRPGLIGGSGDMSDRAGAWVARCAGFPDESLMVPDSLDLVTQVIDVRDLAKWAVGAIENGLTGTFDAVGPQMSLGDWIALARQVAGHSGEVRAVDPSWLIEQGVSEFMGPESLTMWLHDPEWRGFMARTGAAAMWAGLTHTPRAALMQDLLEWETFCGLYRERRSGLSIERECELQSW